LDITLKKPTEQRFRYSFSIIPTRTLVYRISRTIWRR